jgi:hypothetical protein
LPVGCTTKSSVTSSGTTPSNSNSLLVLPAFLAESRPTAKLGIEPFEWEKPSADYYQNQARSLKRRAADEVCIVFFNFLKIFFSPKI